jgi:hypothetical protein
MTHCKLLSASACRILESQAPPLAEHDENPVEAKDEIAKWAYEVRDSTARTLEFRCDARRGARMASTTTPEGGPLVATKVSIIRFASCYGRVMEKSTAR